MKNQFKKQKEEVEEKKDQQAKSRFARSFLSVVSGSFLTKERTVRFLPFFFYLSLLALCYIANGYYAEAKVRQLNKINKELKQLRPEYISTKSKLMFISKLSQVAKAAAPMGLKESIVPPEKIVVPN